MARKTQTAVVEEEVAPVEDTSGALVPFDPDAFYNSVPVPTDDSGGTDDGAIPYIGFRGSRTGNNKPELRAALDAAGVPLHGFYLKDGAGIVALKRFQYHLLPCYHSVATKNDQQGKTIGARPGWKRAWSDEGYSENVFAVVAVILGDSLTPATVGFRGGLAEAIKPAYENLKLASDDRVWKARGEVFAQNVWFTPKFGRFLVTAAGTEGKSKNGPFNLGSATPTPTSNTDLQRLAAHVKDEGPIKTAFDAKCNAAVYAVNKRVAKLLAGDFGWSE